MNDRTGYQFLLKPKEITNNTDPRAPRVRRRYKWMAYRLRVGGDCGNLEQKAGEDAFRGDLNEESNNKSDSWIECSK